MSPWMTSRPFVVRASAARAIAASLLVLIPLLSGAPTAEAGISVIGPLSREATVEPGQTFEGAIELRNTGSSAQEVRLYQTDYLFASDGSNRYDPVGSHERSNGPWLTVTPTIVTIPPRQSVLAHYEGRVPDDANLRGTYWSVIMVEPQVPFVEEPAAATDRMQATLRTVIRYGIQVLAHIGESGERKVRFLDRKIVDRDGKRLLQLDIENAGQRFLAPALWAEFYDRQGTRRERVEASPKRLLPGCSIRHWFDLSELPPDDYRALVVLDNGDDSVFGAQYTLKLTP